jgi:hypothetical protein
MITPEDKKWFDMVYTAATEYNKEMIERGGTSMTIDGNTKVLNPCTMIDKPQHIKVDQRSIIIPPNTHVSRIDFLGGAIYWDRDLEAIVFLTYGSNACCVPLKDGKEYVFVANQILVCP